MNSTRDEMLLNDSILFYPIQYNNYINYIYNLLGEINTPKVYILILLTLKRFGPMPISRIGERLGIARPNMTAMIDGLTERGYIARSVSPADRRIFNIEMTESGQQYIKELTEKLYVIMQEQFSKLSDEEVSGMVKALEYLMEIGKKLIQD